MTAGANNSELLVATRKVLRAETAKASYAGVLNGLERDLEHVLAQTAGIWEEFRESTVFVTGGTGFFGRWLLASFAAANDRFHLNAKAVVLTRDAAGFEQRSPELARHPAITIHQGDVRGGALDRPDAQRDGLARARRPSGGDPPDGRLAPAEVLILRN